MPKTKYRITKEDEPVLASPYHLPGPPPMLLPPVYDERLTLEPLLTVPPVIPRPPNRLVPPLTLTPCSRVGCDAPDTTSPDPPLVGVRNGNVVDPIVSAYQVLALHDEA